MSTESLRKRDLEFDHGTTMTEDLWYNGGLLVHNEKPSGIKGRQITISRDNYLWTQREEFKRISRKRDKPISSHAAQWSLNRDAGAPFETTKHEYIDDTRVINTIHASGASWLYKQSGPLYAYRNLVQDGNDSSWPLINTVDMYNDMLAKGTTAIANTIPTNPASSVAQAFGELYRDGLPSVPGSNLGGRKGLPGAADEFLNYQFGITPFINDFREIGRAVRDSSKILAQLERDSGRIVRRRFNFPVDRVVDTPVVKSTNWYGAPSRRTGSTGAYISGGKLTYERVTETRTWFSGAFTYFYDSGDSIRARITRAEQGANALFGIRLTPELLWELAPWSWAVDWVSNLGDVIHNLSAFTRDGLVMPWGYVMQTKSVTDTYRLSGLSFNSGPSDVSTFQSFKTTVKKRVKATPYGFGLDTDAFTARQWAILTALGVSRGRGAL